MSLQYSHANSNRSKKNAAITVKKNTSAFNKNSSVSSSLLNFSYAKSASEKAYFKTNNRNNEIDDYNRILDVRKAIDKMNFIYPDSSIGGEELSKRKQKQKKIVKSVSSTYLQHTNKTSRLSKSARVNNEYMEVNNSLRPLNYSASKSSFRPSPSNSELQKKQASINTILCQKCLSYHLDRCSLCFNDPNQDVSENEYYYYRTAIESSGYQQQKQQKLMEQHQRLFGKPKSTSGLSINQSNMHQRLQHQATPQITRSTSNKCNSLFLTELISSEASNGSTVNYYNIHSKKQSVQNSTYDNKSTIFSIPPTDLTLGLSNTDLRSSPPAADKQNAFNKSLLALVFKEKSGLGLDENIIESLIENEVIETNNRSTPFPNSFRSSYSNINRTPINLTESISNTNTNVFNNQNTQESLVENPKSIQTDMLSNRAKSCDFLSMRKKNVLNLIKENANAINAQNKKLSEYFFNDMNELRKKYSGKEKKLKLVDVKINKTSNNLYNEIERFDISESYKRQQVSQDLSDLIKREFEETRHVNNKPLDGFISAKHFLESGLPKEDDDDDDSSNEEESNKLKEKKKFNFEPPLTSIEKKLFIDMHRKEFELEI